MEIREKVTKALIQAGTCISDDKMNAYKKAATGESNERAAWALAAIIENAKVAQKNCFPLCDDTGVPHVLLEVGRDRSISGAELEEINLGIADGLRQMPGRPMAIMGDELQRLDQSGGLAEDPAALMAAPLLLKQTAGNDLRIHILLLGGGPAIRAKTYRVFHKHSLENITAEIVSWSVEAVAQLGCTPCTLAVGIGRSHYEATALMLEAQVYGNYERVSKLEREITARVNDSKVGVLGLHGDTTVLGTFLKIGPQRASGVRIVSLRPCCCYEPRMASIKL